MNKEKVYKLEETEDYIILSNKNGTFAELRYKRELTSEELRTFKEFWTNGRAG